MRFTCVLLSIIFLILSGCSDNKDEINNQQIIISKSDIKPGLALDNFKNIYPDAKPDNATGQWITNIEEEGISGNWIYTFTNEELSWFIFNGYIDEISEEVFYSCKNATEKLITKYTTQYGKPNKIEKGIQIFKDPLKENHWGYPVLGADWIKENYSIHISFSFIGGNKEPYRFLVTIEYK